MRSSQRRGGLDCRLPSDQISDKPWREWVERAARGEEEEEKNLGDVGCSEARGGGSRVSYTMETPGQLEADIWQRIR